MRASLPAPNYLEALALKDATARVNIGGQGRHIRRGRLRQHYELLDLEGKGEDPIKTALAYIEKAAGPDVLEAIEPEEVLLAYHSLRLLNQPRQIPAILRARATGGSGTPMAFRYPGRWLAAIVNQVSRAYGWSAEYILDELGPEEAWLYVQEIALDQHREQAFQYSLSTVGRDKSGRQKPLPDISWSQIGYEEMEAAAARARPPIPEKFRPQGTVIRLSDRRVV